MQVEAKVTPFEVVSTVPLDRLSDSLLISDLPNRTAQRFEAGATIAHAGREQAPQDSAQRLHSP